MIFYIQLSRNGIIECNNSKKKKEFKGSNIRGRKRICKVYFSHVWQGLKLDVYNFKNEGFWNN